MMIVKVLVESKKLKEKLPFEEEELCFSRGQTNVTIQEPVQGFGSLGQLGQIALEAFGERIEQRPHIPPLKYIMFGLSPFVKHIGDQTVRAHTDIHRTNYQIMGSGVVDVSFFVGGNPGVLLVPFRHELPNRPRHKLRQITIDVPRVPPGPFNIPVEGQVIADENACTCDGTGREGLVVAVSESEDPAIVRSLRLLLRVDFHEAEIPVSFMGKGMGLVSDTQVGPFEGVLNGDNQIVVRDRAPA